MSAQSDHGEFLCSEDGLQRGAELQCCGPRAFDPTTATCCKADLGNDVRGARICFQGFLEEIKRGRKQKTKPLNSFMIIASVERMDYEKLHLLF